MITPKFIRELAPEYSIDKYGNRVSYNLNGHLHSFDDHPAVIFKDGSMFWYKDGEPHRDNGLPASIWWNGAKYWFLDGILTKYT
jgi:hypothetical protein